MNAVLSCGDNGWVVHIDGKRQPELFFYLTSAIAWLDTQPGVVFVNIHALNSDLQQEFNRP